MKKIIYSDLDGTLFDYNEHGSFISNNNKRAINNWTKDNYFGIASGRNILSIKKLFETKELNINLPFVLTNGACVYDFNLDKVIYKKPISKEVITEAIAYISQKPIATLLLIGANKRYYVGRFTEQNRPKFDVLEINENNINYDDILKIDFLVKPENNLELINDIKKFKNFNLISLVPSSTRYVELVDRDVSKYNGILRALEYYQYQNFKLFTIGDYSNDYEMLKKADYSFAPTNASDKIKSIVNHITRSNKEHAISHMIDIINTSIL